jgi:hypothetical protein
LRGWIKCADGLLYHPVVAEKALEAWAKKREQKSRTKAATEARRQQRISDQRNVQRDDDRNVQRDDCASPTVTFTNREERRGAEQRGVEAPSAPSTTELDNKKATKKELVFKSGCIPERDGVGGQSARPSLMPAHMLSSLAPDAASIDRCRGRKITAPPLPFLSAPQCQRAANSSPTSF